MRRVTAWLVWAHVFVLLEFVPLVVVNTPPSLVVALIAPAFVMGAIFGAIVDGFPEGLSVEGTIDE